MLNMLYQNILESPTFSEFERYSVDGDVSKFETYPEIDKIANKYFLSVKVKLSFYSYKCHYLGIPNASYIPSKVTINMTNLNNYKTVEHYYSDLFHEIGHVIGHKSSYETFNSVTENYRVNKFKFYCELLKEEIIAETVSIILLKKLNLLSEELYKYKVSYLSMINISYNKLFGYNIKKDLFEDLLKEAKSRAIMFLQYVT